MLRGSVFTEGLARVRGEFDEPESLTLLVEHERRADRLTCRGAGALKRCATANPRGVLGYRFGYRSARTPENQKGPPDLSHCGPSIYSGEDDGTRTRNLRIDSPVL